MQDRKKLLSAVRRQQSGQTNTGAWGVPCPWCGGNITGGDLHEWLVKRHSVSKVNQDMIMIPQNVVLLHHECHMEAGQTRMMKKRILIQAVRNRTIDATGRWYKDLVDRHMHQIPSGFYVPMAETPAATVIYLTNIVLDILDMRLKDYRLYDPAWGQAQDQDIRGVAWLQASGKKKFWTGSPPTIDGISSARYIEAAILAHWLGYLAGVCDVGDFDNYQRWW